MSEFNRLRWTSSKKAGLRGGVDDGHNTRIHGWLQYNSSDSARLLCGELRTVLVMVKTNIKPNQIINQLILVWG